MCHAAESIPATLTSRLAAWVGRSARDRPASTGCRVQLAVKRNSGECCGPREASRPFPHVHVPVPRPSPVHRARVERRITTGGTRPGEGRGGAGRSLATSSRGSGWFNHAPPLLADWRRGAPSLSTLGMSAAVGRFRGAATGPPQGREKRGRQGRLIEQPAERTSARGHCSAQA